jgi:hypothetical protein
MGDARGRVLGSDLAAFLTRIKFADGELAKAAAAARGLSAGPTLRSGLPMRSNA